MSSYQLGESYRTQKVMVTGPGYFEATMMLCILRIPRQVSVNRTSMNEWIRVSSGFIASRRNCSLGYRRSRLTEFDKRLNSYS